MSRPSARVAPKCQAPSPESDLEDLPNTILTPPKKVSKVSKTSKPRAKKASTVTTEAHNTQVKRGKALKPADLTVKQESGPSKRKSKGRKKGATGYSEAEVRQLLALVCTYLPVAGIGWSWVTTDYNKWAETNYYRIRDGKGLQAKFDGIVKTKKPTGDAEVPWYVKSAWELDDNISKKVASLTLDDPELRDADLGDGDDPEDAAEASILEITSGSDEEIKNKAPPKTSSIIKVYKINPPVPTSSSTAATKPTRGRIANEALATLSTVFAPEACAERDDQRFASMYQFSQLSTLQTEVRELRARVDVLQDRLNSETRRADKAEQELALNKALRSRSDHRQRGHHL
ncbi:hypothetical protein JAAARDRAFT_197923 [Jaapia argillacea MUCL 33604]|uniref:DUF6818 domain-containing protein n=1 Tax=Jaapia argillacea MUCL 33604 TaxID=933084 RepID=A0A067PNH7_9AGAM|nr:hypothetical protein JAAARDRAFT_197923 [Jaapia argillacea MUCL 33604]